MTEAKTVKYNFDGGEKKRLDHFLVEVMTEHTRSFIQNLIKNGQVLVLGEVVEKSGYKLDKPSLIIVNIPAIIPSELLPEEIPINIVFENKDVVIINKKAGMVVHPSVGHQSGTLVNAVLAACPDIKGIGGEKRPGLVHRLDKDTSGLIILAKNDQAFQILQKQFKDRTVVKKYLTLVDGQPATNKGKIETFIGRDPKSRQRMAVVPESRGKLAISEYNVLETYESHSLLEVKILTGRTHQIRVQMAFLGNPVVGDKVYGRKKPSLPLKRQFLHAATLEIELPGDEKPRIFEAALPDDLNKFIDNFVS